MKKQYKYLEKFIEDFDSKLDGRCIIMPMLKYFLGRHTILTSSFITSILKIWENIPKDIKRLIQTEVREYVRISKKSNISMCKYELWLDILKKDVKDDV